MVAMVSETEHLVADAIGRMMSFWGFRRNLGRIWAALYLSPRPLTSAELCDELKMSTGSVSMALGELKRWGAIRKHHVPGDRKDHWIVEEDIWATVSRVMAQREAREIDQLTEALTRAEADLDRQVVTSREAGDPAAAETAAFQKRRIEELGELAAAGKDLLRLVLGHDQLSPLLGGRPGPPAEEPAPKPRRMLIPRAPEE